MNQIKIEGAKELNDFLKGLDSKLQKQVVSKALRASARSVLSEAKKNAPKATGLLKRSLTVRSLKKRRRSKALGVKVTTAGRAPYAHFTDQGTQDRYTEPEHRVIDDKARYRGKFKEIISGRAFRGRVKPTYWMRDALLRNTNEVLAKFTAAIRQWRPKAKGKAGRV
jgi:HK97 gp10 family phage protein